LAPETDWEKSITRAISEEQKNMRITKGEFYHCRGGYTRQGPQDDSLILTIDFKERDGVINQAAVVPIVEQQP
jgi:hypothetical protein